MKLYWYLPFVSFISWGRKCISNFKWDSSTFINLPHGFHSVSLMDYIKLSMFISLLCKNELKLFLFHTAKPASSTVCFQSVKTALFPQLHRANTLGLFLISLFPSYLTFKPSANPVNITSKRCLESDHFFHLCY